MATVQKLDPELKGTMRASLKAYASGSVGFFDYLHKDVRVFPLDSVEPIAGQKAFKSYYGPTLTKIKRKVKLVSEDSQVFRDQVIVSQLLKISGKGVSTNVRQTVVWGKFDGRWKMAHIHNARVGEPLGLGKAPMTAAGIRILNERIATAASVVGVAQ